MKIGTRVLMCGALLLLPGAARGDQKVPADQDFDSHHAYHLANPLTAKDPATAPPRLGDFPSTGLPCVIVFTNGTPLFRCATSSDLPGVSGTPNHLAWFNGSGNLVSLALDPLFALNTTTGTLSVTPGTVGQVMVTGAGPAAAWGQVGSAGIAAGAVGNTQAATMPARTVKANPTGATAAPQDVPATSDGQVFQRAAGALTWALVPPASLAQGGATTGQLLGWGGTAWGPVAAPVSGITQLGGDVTAGPGTGSQVATIASHAVSYAKMQQSSGLRLLGNPTGSTADVSEIPLGSALAFGASDPPTSGLKLRMRADTGVTTSGANVTAWSDMSGNGNSVTGSTAFPVLTGNVLNGHPAVTFSGQHLTGTTAVVPTNSAREVVAVLVPHFGSGVWVDGGGPVITFGSSNPFFDSLLGIYSGDGRTYAYSDDVSASRYVTSPPTILNTPTVYDLSSTGYPGTLSIAIDGTTYSLDSSASLSELGGAHFVIGATPIDLAGQHLAADVLELFVYDHVLTSGEKTALTDYINAQYALSLPGGSGVAPGLSVTYDNLTLTLNGSGNLQRGAIAGDVNVGAGSNTSSFRSFTGLSLLARTAGTSGVPAEMTATANNQVAQMLGGTLQFHSFDYSQLTGVPSSLPPSGAAGGALAGTYPSPSIASGVIVPGNFSSFPANTLFGNDQATGATPRTIGIGTGLAMDPTGHLLNVTVASGAPAAATYWVSNSSSAPSNAVNMGLLGGGVIQQSVAGGTATPSAFSAGSDQMVFGAASGGGLQADADWTLNPSTHAIAGTGSISLQGPTTTIGSWTGVGKYTAGVVGVAAVQAAGSTSGGDVQGPGAYMTSLVAGDGHASGAGAATFHLDQVPASTPVLGYLNHSQATTPGLPSAGHSNVWAATSGNLWTENSSGTLTHTAQSKTSAANLVLNGLNDDGTWSTATLAAIASSGSASDLGSGTVPAARLGSFTNGAALVWNAGLSSAPADFYFDLFTSNWLGIGTNVPRTINFGAGSRGITIASTGATIAGLELKRGTAASTGDLDLIDFYNGSTRVAEIEATGGGTTTSGELDFWTATSGTLTKQLSISSTGAINVPGLAASSMVKTDSGHFLAPAVAGVDYQAPIASPASQSIDWSEAWSNSSTGLQANKGNFIFPSTNVGTTIANEGTLVAISSDVSATLQANYGLSNYPLFHAAQRAMTGGVLRCMDWYGVTSGSGTDTEVFGLYYTNNSNASSVTLLTSVSVSNWGTLLGTFGTSTFTAAIPSGAWIFLAIYRSDTASSRSVVAMNFRCQADLY